MDNNNNNNNDDNHNIDENQYLQQHQQIEQHRQADTSDDDIREEEEEDAIAALFVKLKTILQRRKEFPLRQRKKIVALAEEYVQKVGADIHEMICDQNDGDNYHGLDSKRDTEAEVETALRFYPEVISRRKDVVWDNAENEWVDAPDGEGQDGYFPIQCLCYKMCITDGGKGEYHLNVKAVSFVILLARLAIELNQFTEEERGGLLIEDNFGDCTLQNLVFSSSSRYGDDYRQLIDNVCLTQLIRLRRIGSLKKEDIRDHNLFKTVFLSNSFPERRFRFLIEWNPLSLLQTDELYNNLPLHLATMYKFSKIQTFELVFDYGIRYYPNKKGFCLLFTKNQNWNNEQTPFQQAVVHFGCEPVMKVVEDTLTRYAADGTPLHVADALITAAIDGNIHLDCVFTLLRRNPAVLLELLSVRPNNIDVGEDNDDDNDNGGGGGGGGGSDGVAAAAADNGNDDDDNPRRFRKKRRTYFEEVLHSSIIFEHGKRPPGKKERH